jgi:hypothetical protein
MRCQRVFVRAASASARSAIVEHSHRPEVVQEVDARPAQHLNDAIIIRERIVEDKNEVSFRSPMTKHVLNPDAMYRPANSYNIWRFMLFPNVARFVSLLLIVAETR